MKDYSIDNRGDIGSVVREECMKSFEVVVPFGTSNNFILDPFVYIQVINELLQQCVEKINRIRVVACKTLINLIWKNNPKIPDGVIPKLELLEYAFLRYIYIFIYKIIIIIVIIVLI